MDVVSQSAFLVAVVSFSLGMSVLARNIRNKLFLSFTALTVAISFWAASFFIAKVFEQPTFYQAHLFLNIWLAPFGIAFIRSILKRKGQSRKLFYFSILFALSLSAVIFLLPDLPSLLLHLAYLAPILIFLQLASLMKSDQATKTSFGLTRSRRRFIYFGGLLVLATSTMDHFPFLGPIVPSIGNFFLSVYLYFLSQAITQQRLLNFSALFYRFLVLATVALSLTGLYSLVFVWVADKPGLFFLNSFIFAFCLVMLLDPLRALMRFLTRQLLAQEYPGMDRTLSQLQQELARIIRPQELFDSIIRNTKLLLMPERTAIFILSDRGTRYRQVRTAEKSQSVVEEKEITTQEMIVDHPLLRNCRELKRKGDLPVLLTAILENEMDRSASRSQREKIQGLIESLSAYHANLLIPFFDGNTVLGFVLMKIPSPPESWGILHVIYPYFRQIGQTLKGMEVYSQRREKERLAELGQMAAGLAHEIRNPLVAIRGAAQLLEKTGDETKDRFSQIIVDETDRLNRVVTEFLEYSRKADGENETFDCVGLLQKTLELLRGGAAEQKRIEFIPPKESFFIRGSSERIHQLLLNLLRNALRAIDGKPDGRVRVLITREEKMVHIVIEDNGEGIKEEYLDKLFLPFFTTAEKGTGLGLPISQRIAESHGGRIEADSQVGKFARFTVILPEETLEKEAKLGLTHPKKGIEIEGSRSSH